MLIIAGEITSKRALEARSKLFNIASTRRVLKLLIDSPGGEVSAGMGLYDALQAVAADVETGCVGQAHSIASLLLACGRRGKRWCAASCSVSLH